MTDDFNESPWTEQQWETFLRQGELRAARFQDLFETLADDPNRDELIDREMGWDREREEPASEFPEAEEELEFEEELEPEEELQTERRRKKSRLSALPAYSASYRWGLKVLKALKKVDQRDADTEEIVARALESCLSVGAKIAGGHALGEKEEAICGNIVYCRRAAAFAQQGIEALQQLADRGELAGDVLQGLIEEGARVRSLVDERIRELRARVWWE
jgi:hypothetical protein